MASYTKLSDYCCTAGLTDENYIRLLKSDNNVSKINGISFKLPETFYLDKRTEELEMKRISLAEKWLNDSDNLRYLKLKSRIK